MLRMRSSRSRPSSLPLGRGLVTVTALGVVTIATGIVVPVSAAPEAKVTICHRTNSTKNHYVRITVAQSSVDGIGGKGDHYAEHTGPIWTPGAPNGGQWGDIIPPIAGVHDGRNWTAEGRTIWAAGCEPSIVARDSDGDGTTDIVEGDADSDADGTPDVVDVDDDNDGVDDAVDPDVDADSDGTPDVTDADDDGDGEPDVSDIDDDGDGITDTTDPDEDPDGDGSPNAEDVDNDNDGTPDVRDSDLDNDSIPDSRDSDDDGDGITDANDPDRRNDGVPDDRRSPDSDGDGIPDVRDRDDDNDGRADSRDPDINGDGITEADRQRPETSIIRVATRTGDVIELPREPATTDAGMRLRITATCSPAPRSRSTRPAGDIASQDLCSVRRSNGRVVVRVLVPFPVAITLHASAAAVASYVPLERSIRVRFAT